MVRSEWKRWGTLCLIATGLLLLTACGSAQDTKEKDQSKDQKQMKQDNKLQVDLMTNPEKIKAGKPAQVHAMIMQKGKPVNDADRVRFDIWPKGEDGKKESLKTKRMDDGMYVAKKTFKKAGKYEVMYHVTARGAHAMDSKTITVRP
ncbi:YtkA-like [Marininema mesophilum]|uniref:YtkA-like n=1 Tax=Marininema mesophilum TaxID=1048340 RepID=A0A1H3BAT0_9BACL|nr:FixH family protein [Marininema mesophilum]SDX39057.1 YtkA-like [Marininema mesophilum]